MQQATRSDKSKGILSIDSIVSILIQAFSQRQLSEKLKANNAVDSKRETRRERVTIGSGFTFDWMSCEPIT